MDILKRYLHSNESVPYASVHETIERLCERFHNSFRLEDRRDALRALKSLSKDYRVEVGSQAIFICTETLSKYPDDTEICCYSIDILCNIMNDKSYHIDAKKNARTVSEDIGKQFTEMFLKDANNLKTLLNMVDYYDLTLRRNSICLVITILENCPREAQEVIFQCPNGISKLVETMASPLEPIRNEGIRIIIELVRGNKNIQRIVAFQNTFNYIFACIEQEGQSDGNIIVEDSLSLLDQLLHLNVQNQNYFRENGFFQKIMTFLNFTNQDNNTSVGWIRQKVVNVQAMFRVIRSLVSPLLSSCNVNQDKMVKINLLKKLCDLILTHGLPPEVLTDVIITCAEMVRSHPIAQKILANHSIDGTNPILTVIIKTLLNPNQDFNIRLAAHYCFSCIVYLNREIKAEILSTFTQKSENTSNIGQILCLGLFSPDSTTVWLSSIAISHLIYDSNDFKVKLASTHIKSSSDPSSKITLLQHCFNSLTQNSINLPARVGILQLMCVWLSHSTSVIKIFLSSGQSANSTGQNISLLISEVATVDNDDSEVIIRSLAALLIGVCITYSNVEYRSQIIDIVKMRVGVDNLLNRISNLSLHGAFIQSSRHPQLVARSLSELLFDYQFTKLFKNIEYEINKCFSTRPIDSEVMTEESIISNNHPQESSNSNMDELNLKIQAFEGQIKDLKAKINELEEDKKFSMLLLSDKNEEIARLKSCLQSSMNREVNHSTSTEPIQPRIESQMPDSIPVENLSELRIEESTLQPAQCVPPKSIEKVDPVPNDPIRPSSVSPTNSTDSLLSIYSHRQKKQVDYFKVPSSQVKNIFIPLTQE